MKRGNLFDSVPANFFNILTGNNKRFYSDCLLELHEFSIFTDAADFDREVVNHPYQDVFLLAVNNSYQFMQEMAKIREVIRDEIDTIFKCNSFRDIIVMLNEYLDSYLNGDYYKLQFEENLTASDREKITGLLMEIENKG